MVIGGVATLVSDRYCDGMGDCLGVCPQGAITLEERDAVPFTLDPSDADIHESRTEGAAQHHAVPPPATAVAQSPSCPGAQGRVLPEETSPVRTDLPSVEGGASALRHWPVQLHLLSPNAPGLRDAELLLCADCVPFAYPDFHRQFLDGHAVAIACPKLDNTAPYSEKLTSILFTSRIRSLTILRMEVPCCGGLVHLARQALAHSGVSIPLREVVIGVQGEILSERILSPMPMDSRRSVVNDQVR